MRIFRTILNISLAVSIGANAGLGQIPPKVVYLPFASAKASLEAFEASLPAELKRTSAAEREIAWAKWIKSKDMSIRSRLAQGDEDTLVNFLLFGTSFTKEPRITFAQIQAPDKALAVVLQKRLEDFVSAMEKPDPSERMMYARQVLIEKNGLKTSPEIERNKLKLFIMQSMRRVFHEIEKYSQVIKAAQLHSDPNAEFAERSTLFKERGLSSDTITQPNFALDRAFQELKEHGVLQPGKVLKIGIVGPGFDFTDKYEGFDFYEPQTIQPFLVMDSLLNQGLANASTLKVATLDLSPRINLHIKTSRERAAAGNNYSLTIPIERGVDWRPEFLDYWRLAGNKIGKEAGATANAPIADTRRLSVYPAMVLKISESDVNIVLQQLANPNANFDIIIATNILVYYDAFEQSLAMANVESMLKPNGIFLTNDLIKPLPTSKLKNIGETPVKYSSRPNDGDTIIWFQKQN